MYIHTNLDNILLYSIQYNVFDEWNLNEYTLFFFRNGKWIYSQWVVVAL